MKTREELAKLAEEKLSGFRERIEDCGDLVSFTDDDGNEHNPEDSKLKTLDVLKDFLPEAAMESVSRLSPDRLWHVTEAVDQLLGEIWIGYKVDIEDRYEDPVFKGGQTDASAGE